jgi:enoyl-CoA hydratase
MELKTILYSEERGIGVVTIHRPEAMNALNAQVLSDLDMLLGRLEKNPELRVLILTGAGEKAFVAGADIKEIDTLSPDQALIFARRGQEIFTRLETARFPVIAAVNGFALGGGCELALACDFIYAAPNAKFGLPECTLGIMPGFGGTVRLARRVGLGLARVATYTGQMYSAQEALQMGLVNKIVEPASLLESAKEVAGVIASRAPHAIAAIKRSINDGYARPVHDAQAKLFADLFHTEDQKEGTRAFIEKRKPAFKGK